MLSDGNGPIGPVMLRLTRAGDYAARVMVHLATLPAGQVAQIPALAEATDVPESFLNKVLQSLVRAGLVHSSRGSHGGFSLGQVPSEVSLLQIIEAAEGPILLNQCLTRVGCHRQPYCSVHRVMVEAQQKLREIFRNASLDRLAAESTSLSKLPVASA